MSDTQSPLPKDDPRLVAWEAYKATEYYMNTAKWCCIPQHVPGSLWAAFLVGWQSAMEHTFPPVSQELVDQMEDDLVQGKLLSPAQAVVYISHNDPSPITAEKLAAMGFVKIQAGLTGYYEIVDANKYKRVIVKVFGCNNTLVYVSDAMKETAHAPCDNLGELRRLLYGLRIETKEGA